MELTAYYDAQRALIGAALLEPKITGELVQAVREEDFNVPELRTLYSALRALFLTGRPVDPVLLVAETSPAFEVTVREILRDTPTAANWRAYAKVLREGAALRAMQDIGAQLAGAVDAADARRILASAEPLMLDRPGIKTQQIGELLADFLHRMEDKTPPNFLEWGIRQMDEKLTAEPGDFIVLGADSSVGKTALAVQLAWNMASRGRRVGFFSLETSARKLADRVVAQRARVELAKIKHKLMSVQDCRGVVDVGRASNRICFDVTEAAGFGVADLRAVTLANRYDVIFIDYVQLLKAEGRERWEIVTRISMELHTMAQQLGVAVVALSQVTPPDKRSGGKAPSKDDLRESRQLKQDADIILLMSLEEPEDNSSARWLAIAKNKDGPLGKIRLDFDQDHILFKAFGQRPEELTELPEDEYVQEELPFEDR